MAHPDETRGGSEKGQREHAGRTSEASDAGMKRKSQGTPGGSDTASDSGAGAAGGHDAGGDTSRGGQKGSVGRR